ncbi:MAG: hypothetical protein DMD71_00215 [Gemmatimonadetes bacterium]|nr:MAG: hypothetical protein DMD71_00215 [Gemmatimonadota bacterium]
MVRKLNNFDDWIDYFRYWQDSIGLPQGTVRDFKFEAKFGEQEVPHIEFGHYKGQHKWPTLMHIPDQRIRDALLNLIVYQGDTEFASVEQQRNLLHHAPSDYDLLSLQRVMTEEMRHGWQMSYLLCAHFGDEGKREAAKLLERRADEGERLLGSFNEIVDNWLDPAQDAVGVGVRSAVALDGPDVEGGVFSPRHRQQRAAADREGRQDAARGDPAVLLQVDPHRVRPVRDRRLVVRALGLRLGVEGAL